LAHIKGDDPFGPPGAPQIGQENDAMDLAPTVLAPTVLAPTALAKFAKDAEGGDGFDPAEKYQMVPLQDQRRMTVKRSLIGPGPAQVALKIESPGIVELGDFDTTAPFRLSAGEMLLPQVPAINFKIRGLQEGTVRLLLVNKQTGKTIDTLTATVKKGLVKKYFIIRLVDLHHAPLRSAVDTTGKIVWASSVYLSTTNVAFQKLGEASITVQDNLGDPLDFGGVAPLNPSKTILQLIVDATPDAVKMNPELFFILYQVWNLRGDSPLNGVTFSGGRFNFIFIEDDALLTTYAHEIGHAFGLSPNGRHDRDPLNIMSSPGTNNRFRFRRSQIDTINPSGVKK
jgi:hypothetical protein